MNINIDTINRLVDKSLNNIGWSTKGNVENISMYSPDEGGIIRFYSPYVHKMRGYYQLSGRIGVYIPDFETYWASKFGERDLFIPFAMIVSNCSQLNPPLRFPGASLDEVDDWVIKIDEIVRRIPDNTDDLRNSFLQNSLAGFPMNFFYAKNAKSDLAFDWVIQSRFK